MSSHNTAAAIKGLGFYVPARRVSNADLTQLVDTSDEWITTRTGIKYRHYAKPGETSSDLALHASRRALADAGLGPEDLTHILMPTITPDYYCPSAACLLEEKLGITGRVAMDLNAACSGFLFGLEMARSILALHPEAVVLVAASDVLTSRTNFSDRGTCVLFGDGSGAAVVCKTDRYPAGAHAAEIMDIILASDGSLGDLLTIRGGGSGRPYKLGEATQEDFYIQMGGREVFRHAVRNMESVSLELLQRHGLRSGDLGGLIPHQANIRIMEAVAKKLGIPLEKVFVNVDRYGNTSGASLPIALAEAGELGFLKPGEIILLTAFGGGFTWGSALLRIAEA